MSKAKKALLQELGQTHLFDGWGSKPSAADESRFYKQIEDLDASYPGGLKAYVDNGRKLLADSKAGVNPLEGWTPSVPVGETVAYVHSKGLKFGLWFGHSMCSGSNDLISGSSHGDDWQQSLGADVIDFAKLDAEMFAKWGVDAVKHDACGSVQNTSAAIAANYDRYMRLSQAINATGRPMLYDVVLQVDTAAGHGASLPHNNYGQVWTPEVYGGKEKMHAMANLWWSLPCNKYDCWECCVQGMTMQNSTASCTTDPEGRGEIPQSIQFINWLT